MIYIKKRIDDIDIVVKLDENTEFCTKCSECGKLLEATDDILDDFTGFLFGSTRMCCDKCADKRKKS